MRKRSAALMFCALILGGAALHADPGDVENSHDYPGFPRMPGFTITDFDEDNPADFTFSVAHPLPTDSGHIENVSTTGHRFVIRYETTGITPSIYQAQRYYEKMASDGGYTIEKTGAAGDTTETFHKTTLAHEIWVYLEPALSVNVVTVMETVKVAPPALPEPPRIVATPPAVRAVMPTVGVPLPSPPSSLPVTVTPVPTTESAPTSALEKPADAEGDELFAQLSQAGRVVVPFNFQPGRDELDSSSVPTVARIVAMMKRRPDLFLRIEGHTDNNGDPEAALRLSAQRAFAVQAALVKAQIEQKRLDAVGVGGLQPLADNTTAQGREKNRRIELVLWKHYSHSSTGQ